MMLVTHVRLALVATLLTIASPAIAKPPIKAGHVKKSDPRVAPKLKRTDIKARVAVGTTPGHLGELRPARESVKPRDLPFSIEEETAKQLEKILRGPLRTAMTGLFVVDARTGEPLFAVNAEDHLNPASNVKMISTATALELLGPTFRYPTRVLGPEPKAGLIKGDVFLLGSYDPTLVAANLDDIANAIAAAGVRELRGDVVVGSDPTRDGIYRSIVSIDIIAGEPNTPPIATLPAHYDFIAVTVTAKTTKYPGKPRLTFKAKASTTPTGAPRVELEIGGTIGKGGVLSYKMALKNRTANAAYTLRAALRSRGILVNGEVKTAELGDFIGDAVGAGALPVELGRHESRPLEDIVASVNKWSINWLADRVIMTAAALTRRQAPSMEIAVDAMYLWLKRHTKLDKSNVIVDTGSGLSYRTQLSVRDLVSVVRGAGGFADPSLAADPTLSKAWLSSLSIGGNDGTLSNRFRGPDVRGRIRGKTGTLSTAIALSGVLDIDPARPLAFALVTNSVRPLSKIQVRKTHELLMGVLCKYAERTAKTPLAAAPSVKPALAVHTAPSDGSEATVPEAHDTALDAETAGQ
ncbi:MAG: D-alanyl-D-alanine carboxypeptidase/D-alanyl-D-alanine-endopeptidase [Deltaproteobacteria bacterium]|nr:D-alanyl-D-alanine carboxypeptidase/D-alanyl-D-alanine-endopeptidase [Deltaproteobacteria bacterium]